MIDAPHVAFRSCEHCQKYAYDETTGRPQEYPPRSGKLIVRPIGQKPNCRTSVGCPKGTPENQKGLSQQNFAALDHWSQCKATGFTAEEIRDPIVRRNAVHFQSAKDRQEKRHWREFRSAVFDSLLAILKR